MKPVLLTLAISLGAQSAFAGSCVTYFKKSNIPATKVLRILDCELQSEDNASTGTNYLHHDQLCVTEYAGQDGKTNSALNFVTKDKNDLTVKLTHNKVTLANDTLRVEDQTNSGLLSVNYNKLELIIKNNSSNKPSLVFSHTKGLRVSLEKETVFAGSYSCKKEKFLTWKI